MRAGSVPLIDPRSRHIVGGHADPTPARAIGMGRQTAIIKHQDRDTLRATVIDPFGVKFNVEFVGSFGECSCGRTTKRRTCSHLRHVFGRYIRDPKPGEVNV